MTTQIVDHLRLVGVAGANRIMAGELSRLTQRAFDDVRLPEPRKQGLGSIYYPFEPKLGALAARYHRTSARALWDLYSSTAQRLEPLYAELVPVIANDRRAWAFDGARISVRAYNVGEFAAGERQVVGTVKNALIDGMQAQGIRFTVDGERPDIHLSVRLYDGVIYVSIDLAGRPMHERGYRQVTGPAPLREDLAAMLIMFSRFDARSEILLDPMAGVGTIPIEASCMAKARPVWQSGRRPACENLPVMKSLMQTRAAPLFGDTQPVIIANEIETQSLEALRANATTAGVAPTLVTRTGDFANLSAKEVASLAQERGASGERGVIVCNPPYGERLHGDDSSLQRLYRKLGEWCQQFPGWRAVFFVANPEFERSFGERAQKKKPMSNGPLRGYFYYYEIE
jgi:23S rRNA G2445 N2-methylase RlmL